MKSNSRRLWPLLLLIWTLLYCCMSSVYAQDLESETLTPLDQSADIVQELPDVQQTVLADEQRQPKDDRPGAAQYEEAAGLLETIKPPRRRLARYTKPTGILGSATYYAKELFSLLFMNGPKTFDYKTAKAPRKAREPLLKAVKLLREAADEGHEDAIFKLAEMNFYGQHTHPRNFTEAYEYYQDLVKTEGNSTAQHMIGFMYATGIGGVVERDQARALLYYAFAADGGDVRAQMTTAFRHHAGIGTPKDCQKAVSYYKQVADEAMVYARSGPPGGQQMLKEAHRLADEYGGVYGEGASAVSSGENAKFSGPTHDTNAAFDDVLEYLDLMSRKGELKAIFQLGRLHYEGSRALQRNYRVARDKFIDVAKRYWDKKGRVRQETEPGVDKLASKAAGYLGRMFLRGEGFEQDYKIARVWFKRGIENGDSLCQYSMGLIYLHGLGVPKDAVKAADYFGAAADQGFATAQVRLGALFMDQGDLVTAVKYFKLAERNGHVEALYYLGEMAHQGVGGSDSNCQQAVLYYKKVAEKAEPIHSNFGEANDAYEDGDLDTALLLYMMGAEQGYEAGQANVAYLLDRSFEQTRSQIYTLLYKLTPSLPFTLRIPFLSASPSSTATTTHSLDTGSLALIYWTRSARQANSDSLLKMGDYYLAGLGVPTTTPLKLTLSPGSSDSATEHPDNSTNENAARAAACYTAAAETLSSAQALFNLGWMHENGIGLAQDFHLAKRYYDAATVPPMREATAPVALALLKLRMRSWWNGVTGGTINSIRDDESAKRKTFWQWFGEFVEAEAELYGGDDGADDEGYLEEWADSLHAAYDGDEWEDLGGGLLETAFIVALAGSLALLVWYRQMVAMRERVRERARIERERMLQQGEVQAQAQDLAQVVQSPFIDTTQQAQQPGQPTSTAQSDAHSSGYERPQQPQNLDQDQGEGPQAGQWALQGQQQGEEAPAWGFQQPGPGTGENWAAGPGGLGH